MGGIPQGVHIIAGTLDRVNISLRQKLLIGLIDGIVGYAQLFGQRTDGGKLAVLYGILYNILFDCGIQLVIQRNIRLFMEVSILATLGGACAMSVPIGFNSKGLPAGMQLVGKPRTDYELLQFCAAYQRANDFVGQFPPKY